MDTVIVEPTIQRAYLCELCSRLYDDECGAKRSTPNEGVGVKLQMIICGDCMLVIGGEQPPIAGVITARTRHKGWNGG